MINEELLNKFDLIQDLPISEEMLGAYIEGHLSGTESSDIELMLQNQPLLSNVYNDLTQFTEIDSLFGDNNEFTDLSLVNFLDSSVDVTFDHNNFNLDIHLLDFNLPSDEPDILGFDNNYLSDNYCDNTDVDFNNDYNINF